MIERWDLVESEPRGHYKVFSVREDRRRSPRTGAEHPFYVIEAGDWVNVIPVTPDGRIVCVRQFRHGIDAVTLEIPGGIIDPDDPSPVASARREMREETGHDAATFVELGAVTPNPALFNNRCWSYLALDARPEGAQALDGTEDIEVVHIRPADVPGLVAAGEISHALVVAAFYLYEQYRLAHSDP